MDSNYIFWLVTGSATLLVGTTLFFIKRYINGLSKKMTILFNKIDELLKLLNVIDKVVTVQSEKVERLENELVRVSSKYDVLEHKVSKIDKSLNELDTFCKVKHNK